MYVDYKFVQMIKIVPQPHKCGVYCLVKDEKVMYIGVSNNLSARADSHKFSPHDKTRNLEDFDYMLAVEIDAERHDLEAIEWLLIDLIRPPRNRQKVYQKKYRPLQNVQRFKRLVAILPRLVGRRVLLDSTKSLLLRMQKDD